MNIRVQQQSLTSLESDVLVIPLTQGEQSNETVQVLSATLNGALREQITRSGFTGKEGETLLFHTQGRLPSRSLLLIGLGKAGAVETETWRRLAGKSYKEARGQGAKHLVWLFAADQGRDDALAAVVEATLLSGYTFDKYKSEKNGKPAVEVLTLAGADLQKTATLTRALDIAQKTAPGVFLARDLINEPASVSTPTYLAEQAAKLSRGNGLKSEIWGLNKIKAAKMSGLLAVARGSVEEPRFIKLIYKPAGKPRKKVALVGKGLTFDSGGLSLKPAKSMETMKLDMSGGATVLGVMQVVSQLKPQVQVTGYVPATENMPSGTAQKPGDIIRYNNGKTVEVLNTDAEGRLILADALIQAAEEKPDVIIDLATLTGACVVALGGQIAGLFSNDQGLAEALLRCSQETGEPLWRLPLVKEYKEDIKSSVADIKNIGSGNAGAIAAALFLEEFVGGLPWAHLDIAGPAFAEKDSSYVPKGGTGFGVRTLVRYLLSL
ncbi:MAG TPA: leucyl aminopeptidase [Candidatus Binatia bacterium]|nr:leucyl aminopeptidase [Candidatus Binatia bacterium]